VPTEAAPEATEIMAAATEIVTSEVVTEQATTAEVIVATEAPTATDTPTEAPTVVIPTDTPTNTPSPEPPTATPTEIPPTETPSPSPTLDTTVFPLMFQYTVIRGDTVGKLATRYGSTVEAIIIANGLNSDAYIYETQILMIPVVALPTATPTASDTPIPQPTTVPPTATPITPTPVPPTNVPPTPVPPSLIPPTPTETAIPVMPASTATTVTQAQSQTVNQPPSTPVVIVQTYVVAYGDTLSSIASRFGIATMDLARVNQIVNPNLIRLGQVLNIPASGNPTPVPTASNTATATSTATTYAPTAIPQPHLYQVLPGDNLYRISIKLNVPISVLIEANGIYDANRIFVGQILIVP
ncbi:MAG: LysM peptidoglycan-binding domain-containing protein, partial [Chloroflexota bacterium]